MLSRILVAVALAVPLLAVGGTAQAAACSGSTGVTVIVQFPAGSTTTGCAPGDPSTGAQALTSAGFSVRSVDGRAFVCQINGQPSSQTCTQTPPTSAYWAYFHAKRGGGWSFSNEGAYSYNPAPGSVEGWRFGSGAKPSTPPPGRVAPPKATATPKPVPQPTAKPSSTPTSVPTSGPTTSASKADASAAATASALASKSAGTKTESVEPTPSAAPTSAGPSASATALVAAPEAKNGPPTDQGGGTVAWWWGLVALVVLGGGAGVVTLARRRQAT